MDAHHFVFALSIILILIGKRLDATNYTAWISRRKKSYAAPLGLTEFDSITPKLLPSESFAAAFYENVRIYWRVRRQFFLNIYGMSMRPDLLGAGMSVVIALLRGAEMTNWTFISYWLLEINPELLMWNELAKHWPALCAAAAKFNSLGQYESPAKLVFPPEEVPEFQAAKLAVPYAVARDISEKYGNASVNQIVRTKRDSTTTETVTHALMLIRIAGGAKTVDTMALRSWKFNGFKNDRLERFFFDGSIGE